MAYPSSREICEKSDEIHRETAYLQIRGAYIGGLTFQRAVHAHGALVVAEHAGIAPFVAAGVDQFPSLALVEGYAAGGAHGSTGIVFQETSDGLEICKGRLSEGRHYEL